ncbi:MAG: type II toxin-antitoxin system VapC family toxin [Wenzhouxiangellaceae bacterium]
MAWFAAQSRPSLFTTTITQGELFYGLRLLPDGQRRTALLNAIHDIFNQDLDGQVLSFNSTAADAYADIAAWRQAAGQPISQFDAMIAGIAQSRGASLATRNLKDFVDCGIELIDPWAFDQR